ncbi:MAG: hypothetical protein ACR2N3_13580 [Pyrinomonadaceae bacterium]
MKKRNLPKNEKTNKVQRQRDSISWRYCFLVMTCGLILATGFFFAARQHFSAIEYGIKNAKLRRQKEDLENLQRQLYLAKEVALSPVEIKKAAKKIGLQEFAAGGMETVGRKIENAASATKKAVDQKLAQEFLPKPSETKEEKSKSEKDLKEVKETKAKSSNFVADNIRPRVIGK